MDFVKIGGWSLWSTLSQFRGSSWWIPRNRICYRALALWQFNTWWTSTARSCHFLSKSLGPQMAQWSSTDCLCVYMYIIVYIYICVNQLGKFLLLHARRDMESQLIIRWCWRLKVSRHLVFCGPLVVWRWCFCQCYTWDAGLKCQGRLLSKHIPLLALRGVGGEGRRGCQLE